MSSRSAVGSATRIAQVGGAVPAAAAGQRGHRRGVGLLALQGPSLVVLADLGGDHVEDPAAQDPQLPRPEPGRFGHQPLLRLRDHLTVDVVGQRVHRRDDHLGLGPVDLAVAQGPRHDLPAGVQRPGQPQVPTRLAAVASAVVGQPGADVPRPLLNGDVVGRGHDPQPQLRQPRGHPVQRQQRRLLLSGGHEDGVEVGDVLQRSLEYGRRGDHRMRLRIHTRSLARTTVQVRGIAGSTQVVEPSAPLLGELPERGGEITGNTCC